MINTYIIEYKPTSNSNWVQLDRFVNGTLDQLHRFMEKHYRVESSGYERNDNGTYTEYFTKHGAERFRAIETYVW